MTIRSSARRWSPCSPATATTSASAENGAQAIAAVATPPAIDVVLLDLNMPGAPWRTVVTSIRSTSPTTRIVVFTGGLTQPEELVDDWLTKPASPDAILGAISRALAR